VCADTDVSDAKPCIRKEIKRSFASGPDGKPTKESRRVPFARVKIDATTGKVTETKRCPSAAELAKTFLKGCANMCKDDGIVTFQTADLKSGGRVCGVSKDTGEVAKCGGNVRLAQMNIDTAKIEDRGSAMRSVLVDSTEYKAIMREYRSDLEKIGDVNEHDRRSRDARLKAEDVNQEELDRAAAIGERHAVMVLDRAALWEKYGAQDAEEILNEPKLLERLERDYLHNLNSNPLRLTEFRAFNCRRYSGRLNFCVGM
jgi:hypothetical protein